MLERSTSLEGIKEALVLILLSTAEFFSISDSLSSPWVTFSALFSGSFRHSLDASVRTTPGCNSQYNMSSILQKNIIWHIIIYKALLPAVFSRDS